MLSKRMKNWMLVFNAKLWNPYSIQYIYYIIEVRLAQRYVPKFMSKTPVVAY